MLWHANDQTNISYIYEVVLFSSPALRVTVKRPPQYFFVFGSGEGGAVRFVLLKLLHIPLIGQLSVLPLPQLQEDCACNVCP